MFRGIFLAGLLYEQKEKQHLNFKLFFRFLLVGLGSVLMLLGFCLIVSEIMFFKAYQDYFLNKFKSSRQYLSVAIFLNPTNQMFYAYQAANGIFLDDPHSLLENRINYILKLQKQDSKSYLTAAKLYFLLYDKTGTKDYLNRAIAYMDECLATDPYFAQRYYRAGFYRAEAGELAAALEKVQFGVSLTPKDVPGWLLLARIYQLQGKQKQTLYALERAYKFRPDIDDIRWLWFLAKKEPQRFKELPIPAIIDTRNFD